jgi:Aspartyl/Asparaginyl beta-hydroxylase
LIPRSSRGPTGWEENWQTIRDEAEAILQQKRNAPLLGDISPDHRWLDHRRSWRAFILWGYGYRADHNCLLAPRTAGLVDDIPGLVSVMFSVHEAGHASTAPAGTDQRSSDLPPGAQSAARPRPVPDRRGRPNLPLAARPVLCLRRYLPVRGVERQRGEPGDPATARSPTPRVPGRWVQQAIYQLVRVSPFVQDVRRSLEALRRQ